MPGAHRGDGLHSGERVRVRLDACGAQLIQLPPPIRKDAGLFAHNAYFDATSILVILSLRSPLGVEMTTSSPRLCPSSALPTGDSLESFISAGFASAEPTIVYLVDLPDSSLTCTSDPTLTMSVPRSE